MALKVQAIAASALALCLTAGSAGAAEAAQVYFANIMDAPVEVSIDDQPAGSLAAKSANGLQMKPGEHVILVTMADGSSISKPWVFEASALAKTRKDSWWCLAVAPRKAGSDSGYLVQLPAEQCKAFIEASG
ncbi:MAG: hypothetical protein JWP35_739 [Caulobacter sp.]|nr:hypothetical protein [Caulobacter sp.]